MFIMKLYLILAILCLLVSIANCLECYICANQSSNAGKCVQTLMTCDVNENRCLSFVRWGGTPYWAPSANKQYYISKKCASKNECENTIHRTMPRCKRIWYEDWECGECCQGNRCNYFVTLGTSSSKSSLVITAVALGALVILHKTV